MGQSQSGDVIVVLVAVAAATLLWFAAMACLVWLLL